MRGWIAQKPDLTLGQISERLRREKGVGLRKSALAHQLARMGLSYKKTLHAAGQSCPDVRRARRKWRETHQRSSARGLVFLDETGVNTKMSRLYGRSPRGQRCVCAVPHAHWVNYTVVSALRHNRLFAARVIKGAMNAECFTEWVPRVLLARLRRGDTVVCDNLSVHKCAAARELIEACGCKLVFLPPYSPDLNPIEQANAKLKSDLRGEEAREYGTLVAAARKSARRISPAMCWNFFSHAGYATT